MLTNLRLFLGLAALCLGLFSLEGCSSGSGGSGGTSSAPATPAPTLTSITPASAVIGSAPVTLTVTGSNFTSATTVQFAGASVATTFNSSTQVTATLTAGQLASAGALTISLVTGNLTSTTQTFTVQNPAPTISSVTPSTVAAGSTLAGISVTGTGFVTSSTALFNGASRPTAYLSATELMISLTAADLQSAGAGSITVINPAPGGGTSGAAKVSISGGASTSPVINSLDPSSVVAGSVATTLRVEGTNFVSGCSILLNGSTTATGVLDQNTLSTTIPATLLAGAGSLDVTVTCAEVTSNDVKLQVSDPPAPVIANLATRGLPLNVATVIQVYGSDFTEKTVLQLDGTSLPTTVVDATQIYTTIPASMANNLAATYTMQAYTPGPGGGTSQSFVLLPYVGLANNSMVYNPANGLFYLSVPSSVGAPYGNSVVSVDPVSGSLGTPIFVGSEPDRLAITTDGSALWVALDGASAVAKVDLAAGKVAYQFGLGGNSGTYASPPTVQALAALPGSPDSVVVAAMSSGSFNNPVQIFDKGVVRTQAFSTYIGYATALQVDGTRSEIYGAGNGSYYVFGYDSTGLTTKVNVSGTFGQGSADDLQIAGSRTYTDGGKVYDAESGSLLGTLYSSGTNLAQGPTVADATLGKIFVLTPSATFGNQNQIQVFDLNSFVAAADSIPVIGLDSSVFGTGTASHLTRWGSNGLAYRSGVGFYSLRSKLVKDLSSTKADLSVSVSAPAAAVTGSSTSFSVTVRNSGPAAATGVDLVLALPSTGVLDTLTGTQGSCGSEACDVGTIAAGASVTVVASLKQLATGAAVLTATATGSEIDPTPADSTASATVMVSGAGVALAPAIQTVIPSTIQTGLAADTTIEVAGANFSNGCTVSLGATALVTTFVDSATLMAVVPAARSTTLGWDTVTVTAPAGGGSSNGVPLTYYKVITAGLNHILYDPFTRKIMASVGSGSSSLTGNSLVAITPETGEVGTAVSIGSQPSVLALSDDGSLLYTILSGANSIARFNMLTQTADYTYAPPADSTFVGGISLRGVAVQPGHPNTVALDIASFSGIAIYDFDPAHKTAAIRGQATGPYTGSSLQFLDANNLYAVDLDTSGSTFNHFTVTAKGFTYYNYSQFKTSTLNHFGAFTIKGGLAFANNGGVANPATDPATQLGYYPPATVFVYNQIVAPDPSLGRVFFFGDTVPNTSGTAPDGIIGYDQTTFLPTGTIPLNVSTIEGSTQSSGVDLQRWGVDGLAALTNTGHLYLLRGPAVMPAELASASPAMLSTLSTATVAHGSSNTILSVTGANFMHGAGVFWNGAYRTTTWISSTQMSFDLAAADLAAAGTATVTVVNPGAVASGGLSVSIQ